MPVTLFLTLVAIVAVAWALAALLVALLVGGAVRLRDEGGPR
jgi:hypothetical protein